MKSLLTIFTMLLLTACGQKAGSGGSSTTPVNQVIKSPAIACSGVDCITGASLSKSSGYAMVGPSIQAMSAGDEISNLKDEYDRVKVSLSQIQEQILSFNRLATEEELESCEDIPTTGSFTVEGSQPTLLEFSAGDFSFDIGSGLTAMQRKIEVSTNGTPLMEIQVNCTGTVQTVYLLMSGTVNTTEKHLMEAFYRIDSSTGATNLQFAEISGSDYRNFASFKTLGGKDFELTATVRYDSNIYRSVSAKTWDDNATTSDTYLEYVYSNVQSVDLNSLTWGSVAGQERVCAFNYKTASPTVGASSCSDPMNGSAPATALVPSIILIGDASDWTTDSLDTVVIRDLLNRP